MVGLIAADLKDYKCLRRPKKEMDRYQLHGVVWCGVVCVPLDLTLWLG